jgi:hypothetical protein
MRIIQGSHMSKVRFRLGQKPDDEEDEDGDDDTSEKKDEARKEEKAEKKEESRKPAEASSTPKAPATFGRGTRSRGARGLN